MNRNEPLFFDRRISLLSTVVTAQARSERDRGGTVARDSDRSAHTHPQIEFTITQIGTVASSFTDLASPSAMREADSRIVLDRDFVDGLTGIEMHDRLTVLFYLHEARGGDLVAERRHGSARGLFASRSPHSPTPIGVTTVELLERDGCRLYVAGLDAIDGTPVLDIKPYAATFDGPVGP